MADNELLSNQGSNQVNNQGSEQVELLIHPYSNPNALLQPSDVEEFNSIKETLNGNIKVELIHRLIHLLINEGAKSRQELSSALGLGVSQPTMTRWLNTMIDNRLIINTSTNKNAPNQKYAVTNLGKLYYDYLSRDYGQQNLFE